MKTREEEAQEFLKTFELVLNDNDEVDDIPTMPEDEELIDRAENEITGALVKLICGLKEKNYDISKSRINSLRDRVDSRLRHFWKSWYYNDEVSEFLVRNQDAFGVDVDEFLDSLPDPVSNTTYDGELSNSAREYVEYAEEMKHLSHMTGDLDMCATTVTRKEQPINPKRLKKINEILKTKRIYLKGMNRDCNPTYDKLPEEEF